MPLYSIATHLNLRLGGEADQHEKEDGNDVVGETGPVVDLEGGHESTHQHKENRAGSENGASHQHHLQTFTGQHTPFLINIIFYLVGNVGQ